LFFLSLSLLPSRARAYISLLCALARVRERGIKLGLRFGLGLGVGLGLGLGLGLGFGLGIGIGIGFGLYGYLNAKIAKLTFAILC